MTKRTIFERALFMALGVAVLLPAGLYAGPVAQNQCPGDCSPCLGPSDPFCPPAGTGSDGGTGSYFCVICDAGECRDAEVGERGKDASCTVTTMGMTVISCVTEGNSCNGIATVTP